MNRLSDFIEDNNPVPHTMLGFRKDISTQDAFLILKEEVLQHIPRGGEHLILALDLKGAFDHVSHRAILQALNELHCAVRTYNYVKAFLSDRTASIEIGDVRSGGFKMQREHHRDLLSSPCFSILQ